MKTQLIEATSGYLEAERRIARLGKKKALDLSGLGLTTLPETLYNHEKLVSLDLRDNLLADLLPEFAKLFNLQVLWISKNQLTDLPVVLRSLDRLILLDIAENQMSALPDWIGSLTMLEHLYANANQFKSLPRGIGGATNLKSLFVYDNRISVLPEEIGNLKRLQFLVLFSNQLSKIPSKIGELENAELIDLSLNRLRTLPASFGQLKSVMQIDLSNNAFRNVPPSIRRLHELQKLGLEQNRLETLPVWLTELKNLAWIGLNGNEELNIPPTVTGPPNTLGEGNLTSARSVLDYYFQTRTHDSRPLNEVKLVMVGRGGAGKTSAVRALQGLPFNNNEASTPGIALCDWTLLDAKGSQITAHIWDFAGQVITHALHQFFFSKQSVYVLMLTGRENSERDDAEYWLRLIRAFGTDEQNEGPPVIVALNKWDVPGCQPKIDRSALQERYPFIRCFVELDCKSGRGVEKLKGAFAKEVSRLKWVKAPFPTTWDNVRRSLTTGVGNRAHLTYSEYRALCAGQGISDESEQDSLAEILHNLGVALNYRTDRRLREATVLRPEWLTKNVYALVRRAERQAGILTQDDVDSVLRYERNSAMRVYLMRLMERFEIAYSPKSTAGMWLIPQALPDQQPKGVMHFRDHSDATRLRYTYTALPEGLVPRAIVRLSDFIDDEDGVNQQWASGVIVTRANARALIRTEPQDRLVTITVTGEKKARRQLAGLCQAEMREIHGEIRGLDPIEETYIHGTWVPTSTLEVDERDGRQTGVPTRDRGTVYIDPIKPNNEYSEKSARVDNWKPTVFISYSKADVANRKRLETQLKLLMNEGLIAKAWHDRMIDPGDFWDEKIQRQLAEADVVIVLVSSNALATDYIMQHEIPKALTLHKAGDTVVVPLILESCRWSKTGLGELNALPEKARPLNKWRPVADGWDSVTNGLAGLCERLIKTQATGRKLGVPRLPRLRQ